MEKSSSMINCFSLEGQLAKLEVMGSEAFQLLQRTLCPVTRSKDHTWALKINSVGEAEDDSQSKSLLENEKFIPSHAILSLRVKDPRTFIEKRKTVYAPGSPVEELVICKEKHDWNKKFFCLDESSSGALNTSTNLQ